MTSICVQTFGCSANFSDGEIMKGVLKEAQFEIVDRKEDADIIVLNLCTVKGDHAALREVRKAKEEFPYKKLVVAGCVPKHLMQAVQELAPEASVCNTLNIKKIAEAVEETIHDNPVQILARKKIEKINLPRIRNNPVVGIVQIGSGCDSACTFCSVKLIKGYIKSFPIEDIVRDVQGLVQQGCREIWLTSTDNGCYGADIGTNLPALLREVVKVEGEFMVRAGMANPKHFMEFLDELIDVYTNPKIFKFLHIPVQSGNNRILKEMKRDHDAEAYKKIVKLFREKIPNITISTDIICGFPGETETEFRDSITLVEETKPDVLNISRYAERPGTRAAAMPGQVLGEEKKRRTTYLASVFDWIAYEQNLKWKNWEGKILIDEIGKNGTLVGRNFAYKPVIITGNFRRGDVARVRINAVTKYDLRGEVVEEKAVM